MFRWKFEKIMPIWVTIAILVLFVGCENPSTSVQQDESTSSENTPTSPPDTSERTTHNGIIVVGNLLGNGIQTGYYFIDKDLFVVFGSDISRDGVFSPNRDSVYFNYGGLGNGIWACPIDTVPNLEPILVYDSPYMDEFNLCRVPEGIVFNIGQYDGTFMLFNGDTCLGPGFSCGTGAVISVRVCPADSSLIAVEFWGVDHRTWIFQVTGSETWDTLRTFEGDFFAWFDLDPSRIVVGNSTSAFVHQLYGDRDSVEIPLPTTNLRGLLTSGLKVIGIFAPADSTEIWTLEANDYIARKITTVEGFPLSFDSSPFAAQIVLATNRGEWKYVTIVDLDSGEKRDVLIGTAISRVRWK